MYFYLLYYRIILFFKLSVDSWRLMERITGIQFLSGVFWRLTEVILTRGVSLAVSIILARLLMPSDYGLIVLTMVFILFSDIFIQNGFNISLIRQPIADLIDYSTVMYLSYASALILYSIFFLASPTIAQYYSKPELSAVLRVLALVLFFKAGAAVIRAKAIKEMQFKLMSFITFIASVVSGIVGVIMAVYSMGVWALVAQQLAYYFLDMTLLVLIFKWRFNFNFSISVAKKLFSFSANVIGAGFLDFAANNVANLFIGKLYPPKYLGYISRGSLLPEQVYTLAFNSVNMVILPVLASRQNDISCMKKAVRKMLVMATYLSFPMMGGLALVGRNLILLLLTDKWLPCVPIMQWYCLTYACNMIRSINGNVFYARGESKIVFVIEVVRCVLMILNMIVSLIIFKVNVYKFVMLNSLLAVFVVFISQIAVNRVIGYKCRELFKDIYAPALMTFLMMYFMYLIGKLAFSPNLIMCIQITIGIFVYAALSFVFKASGFSELLKIFKLFFERITLLRK